MEGFGGLFGDPDELQRRMAEFAEQMQGQQRLAWADNAIKLAVDMTVAAINRVNVQGNAEQQAQQIRSLMAVIFRFRSFKEVIHAGRADRAAEAREVKRDEPAEPTAARRVPRERV